MSRSLNIRAKLLSTDEESFAHFFSRSEDNFVLKCDEEQISSLKQFVNQEMEISAIYDSREKDGKIVSGRLTNFQTFVKMSTEEILKQWRDWGKSVGTDEWTPEEWEKRHSD
jgi:hypothetical protein